MSTVSARNNPYAQYVPRTDDNNNPKFPLQSPIDTTSVLKSFSRHDTLETMARGVRPEARDTPVLSPKKRPRPGLNIVTDFKQNSARSNTDPPPERPSKAQRPQYGERAMTISNVDVVHQEINDLSRANAFVNLKDLANLGSRIQTETATTIDPIRNVMNPSRAGPQQGRLRKDKPIDPVKRNQVLSGWRNANDTKPQGQPTLHAASPEKVMKEISPSARTIVIGIDNAEYEREMINHSNDVATISREPSQKTPMTPSIVITPADETASWPYENERQSNPDSMRRPTSSVYSQATANAISFTMASDAPPMPPIPSFHKKTQIEDKPKDHFDRCSIESWESDAFPTTPETAFDVSPYSRERQTRARDDRSMASDDSERRIVDEPNTAITNPRRSKGWWNLMLSPILSRSNTLASKKTPITKEAQPPLPSIPDATQTVSANEKDWHSDLSPETPRRVGASEGSVSTWSRWSDWERDREMTDSDQGESTHSNVRELPRQNQAVLPTKEQTPLSPPVVQGLAAEYFQACAHDMISPAPYFECENHSCTNKLPELILSVNDNLPGGGTGARGLGGTDETVLRQSNARPTPKVESAEGARTDLPGSQEGRGRADSDSTIIEDDSDVEVVPNEPTRIQRSPGKKPPLERTREQPSRAEVEPSNEAVSNSAKKVQATPGLPPYSPPRPVKQFPAYRAILPPDQQPASPLPVSPEAQRVIGSPNGIPMSQVQIERIPPSFVTNNYYTHLPPRPNAVPQPVPKEGEDGAVHRSVGLREQRQREEEEDEVEKKPGRSCFPQKGCLARSESGGRKRRIWIVLIAVALVSIVITAIVLATTLTRKGDNTPVQSQWLNLTNFPPMPTGISTVAQPDVLIDSACAEPSTLWSCALPKEEADLSSGDADQPNFRIEIRFRNETINGTTPIANETTRRSLEDETSGRTHLHRSLLQLRDVFRDSLFTPSPAPPSLAEQTFLGNTTDNNTYSFDGEATPFFITFLSTTAATLTNLRMLKRHDQTSTAGSNSTDLPPSLNSSIPSPSTLSDGVTAPANLLPSPFPISQPVRLYNRNLSTEHYGFYTYFDRSIFVSSTNISDSSSGDNDGGVAEANADFRCTWAQTRFLVQIWTSPQAPVSLLPSLSPTTNSSSSPHSSSNNSTSSSAIDFSRPGSFSYPITITMDRHGGSQKKKMLYCYTLDDEHKPIEGSGQFLQEFRSAGGVAVNPAPGFFDIDGDNDGFNKSAGGIDGGSGGCSCQWNNFQGNGV